MRRSDLCRPSRTRFRVLTARFPSLGGTAPAPFSLPAGEGRPPVGLDDCGRAHPCPPLERRPAEPPRFLAVPNVHMPRSSTPPGRRAWRSHASVLPSVVWKTSAPGLLLSGLNSAAYALPVYASQRPVIRPLSQRQSWGLSSGPVSTQDSVPAVAIFAGWSPSASRLGGQPTGTDREVSV